MIQQYKHLVGDFREAESQLNLGPNHLNRICILTRPPGNERAQ